MLRSLRVRMAQGRQYIPDLRAAQPENFRGLPLVGAAPCAPGCVACVQACATSAIDLQPLTVDLARCVQCGDCVADCPTGTLTVGHQTQLAAVRLDDLRLTRERPLPPPIAVSEALRQQYGRSLRLRSVSAGGCNGCEAELNAVGNVNFDLGRYGIEFVASPRHADGLVLSGPVSAHMAQALQLCWDAMPRPRFVVAFGACALSGGPYAAGDVSRGFLAENVPVLWLPGCPPHPLTLVRGLMDLLGIDP